jgi:nucleoside-diphosphate-sugar epimerase
MSGSKRVLVTGGAGFIGSHLCDALLERGFAVTCLDNMSTGDEANIASAQANRAFEVQRGDVCDPFDFDVDLVFHLASPASPVDYYGMRVETMHANSLGTLNCLELARRKGARLVMASTSEVYGDPQVSPQKEEYFGYVNPVGPRSCYDEGKRFAEAACKAYESEYGTEVVIVRIFNTYGSRMRSRDGRVIPNFVSQALSGEALTIYGEGDQTRSFCHVSDMVRGLILAMLTPGARGEVINLGNPNEMRIIDLASRVRQKVGSGSEFDFRPLPVDDPLRRKPDITRAMDILAWAPEIELEDGLDDVIAWFREGGRGG